jgi:transcriptional regulator with PAS, ATPase and Fis domain
MDVLISWLGKKDIDESKGIRKGAIATIATSTEHKFDLIYILLDNKEYIKQWEVYYEWLNERLEKANKVCKVEHEIIKTIQSPIDFEAVAIAFRPVMEKFKGKDVIINLSSGTRAGSAISILLGHFIHKHKIIQVKDGQIEQSEPPFNFEGEYTEQKGKTIEQAAISKPKVESSFDKMVTNSSAMQHTVEIAKRLVPYPWPCLIMGETGTGKDVMAQAISKAAEKELISVNCAAIPAELIESELFGHEKGAFSGASKAKKGFFEQADNNILFLDEIGDLPLDAQTKLLRVLQSGEFRRVGGEAEKKVNVRIICATHKDLARMIEQGEFREDLYYRINVGVIEIPPLKERSEDIMDIAVNLLAEINEDCSGIYSFKRKYFHMNVNSFIKSHQWPGNVRELKNTIARAVIFSDGECITSENLEKSLLRRDKYLKNELVLPEIKDEFDAPIYLKSIQKQLVTKALDACSNKSTEAANLLGLSYRTFKNWEKSSSDEE